MDSQEDTGVMESNRWVATVQGAPKQKPGLGSDGNTPVCLTEGCKKDTAESVNWSGKKKSEENKTFKFLLQ